MRRVRQIILATLLLSSILVALVPRTAQAAYAPVWNQNQMAVPIQLRSWSWGPGANGDIYIDGEIQNVGLQNAEQVQVWFALYNKAHQMLSATTISAWMDIIEPGEIAPLHGWFFESGKYDAANVASVGVTAIDSTASSRAPNHWFITEINSITTDPSTGDVHIKGSVWNLSDIPVDYVQVVFEFFDPTGAPVDTAETSLVYVPPGSTTLVTSVPARGVQDFDLDRPATAFTPSSPDDMDLFVQSPTAPAVGGRLTQQIYHDLLGRASDPAGLGYWGGQVDSGKPLYPLALSLAASDEYRGEQVQAQYQRFLGRSAEGDTATGSLGHWVQYLASGATLEQLGESLIASDEYFLGRGKGDNGSYVDALYSDLLGRAPDPQGRAYWVDRLDHGAARWLVSSSILNGTESVQTLVKGVFQSFLHHDPDPAGLAYWVGRVQGGMRDEVVVASIMASDEYVLNTLTQGP